MAEESQLQWTIGDAPVPPPSDDSEPIESHVQLGPITNTPPDGYTNWRSYSAEYTEIGYDQMVQRMREAIENQFWHPPPGQHQPINYWIAPSTAASTWTYE